MAIHEFRAKVNAKSVRDVILTDTSTAVPRNSVAALWNWSRLSRLNSSRARVAPVSTGFTLLLLRIEISPPPSQTATHIHFRSARNGPVRAVSLVAP
jgi:hypothetical protein